MVLTGFSTSQTPVNQEKAFFVFSLPLQTPVKQGQEIYPIGKLKRAEICCVFYTISTPTKYPQKTKFKH